MEAALNRAVDLDPDTRARLDVLDGRSVQVHLSGPDLALRISVEKGRLRVGPPEEGGSLRVTASPYPGDYRRCAVLERVSPPAA